MEAVEYENERLRAASVAEPDITTTANNHTAADVETLQQEKERANERANLLEEKHSILQNNINSYSKQIDALQAEQQQLMIQLAESKSENERLVKVHEQELEGRLDEVTSLKDLLGSREARLKEKETLLELRNERVELLERQIEQMGSEFDEDRRELGAQIDELRIAGQVYFMIHGHGIRLI